MGKPVHLLETTLRDGSYEIDFQFRPEDTALIVGALDQAGIRYIEIAHGCGVGTAQWPARTKPGTRSTTSDEAHLAAAHAAAKRAQIGILYVVGKDYTPREWLKTAVANGVRFIRYAFSPGWTSERENWAYLEDAKAAGLTVSVNMMKTYTAPVAQIAKWAADAKKYGADWYYIVDSAGGMTPQSVREYTRAIIDASGLEVGLHAHNNGALALANSLAAVDAGATLIDATLQGIGRATGNASTEQALLALQRLGHELDVDPEPIFRLGDLARALFAEQGNDPTWFASGAAQLHSRVVTEFRKIAKDKNISERSLLLEVGRIAAQRDLLEQESFAPDIMEAAIAKASPRAPRAVPAAVTDAVEKGIARASGAALEEICDELFVTSRKRRKLSVLHVVDATESPFPTALSWETEELVGVTLPMAVGATDTKVPADRTPDLLIADPAYPDSALPVAHARLRLPFARLVTDAAVDVIDGWAAQSPTQVWVPADPSATAEGVITAAIATQAAQQGHRVSATRPSGRRILVVASGVAAHLEHLGAVEQGDAVLFVGPMTPAARSRVAGLRERGVVALRPSLAPVISALVARRRAVAARLAAPLTPVVLSDGGGLAIVDPALAPATGEVVVDSAACPSRVVDGVTPATVKAVGAARAAALFSGRGSM